MIPDLAAVTNRFGSSLKNLLVFRLGSQAFAISIEHVVQIIPMLRLTPLPQSDSVIQGVANIRGTITPMINVRKQLGMTVVPPKLHTPIILIRLGTHLMGFIVDEVIDVLSLPASQVARPEAIMPEGVESSPVLDGVVFLENHTILLIDPQALLNAHQIKANLDKAIASLPKAAMPPVSDPVAVELPVARNQPPMVSFQSPEPCDDETVITPLAEAIPPAAAPVSDESAPLASPAANEKPAPRKRSRSQRAKTEKVLADQVASLAENLPPVNGEGHATDATNPPVQPASNDDQTTL